MRVSTKNPVVWLWVLYTLFVAYSSLIPFSVEAIPSNFSEATVRMIAYYKPNIHISKLDILANLLFYIPFGFLTTGLAIQYGFGVLFALGLGTVLSTFLSFFLEVGQVYFSARTSSVFDLFLNTASGFAGAFAAAIYFPLFHQWSKETFFKLLHEKPFFLAALILGGLIFSGGLMPLDISVQISDIKNSIKEIQWIPFIVRGDEPLNYANLSTNFFLFTAFALLCHFSFRLYSSHLPSVALPTIFLTLCLAGVTEFAQIFIISRTTNTTDLVIAALAATLATVSAPRIEKLIFHINQQANLEGRAPRSVVALYLGTFLVPIYSAIVAYLLLAPLNFQFSLELAKSKLSWSVLVPFHAYWAGSGYYLFALEDLLFTMGLFGTLGALLYFCIRGFPFASIITVFYCVLLSTAIEGLQFFEPGRVPEITDVLSATLGSVLGIFAIRNISKFLVSK
jgi:VanZ family protein